MDVRTTDGTLVVSKDTFAQCGINKKADCSAYGRVKKFPLDDVRAKLVDGIRSDKRADVLDILVKTFNDEDMKNDQDAIAYLSSFSTLQKTLIVSENSNDWLAASAADNIGGGCAIE